MLNNYETAIQLAESALSSTFNSPVHLVAIKKFDSRNLVLRCKLITASDNAPSSVILKQMAVDASPEQSPRPLDFFLNEVKSLRLFNDLRDQFDFGPRLYCCHHDPGFLIIEDLGDHQTLWDILKGNNSRVATDALVKFARYLGKVQVATLGKESTFRTLQCDAPASSLSTAANQNIRYAMRDLRACLDALRIKPPVGLNRAIDTLQAAIHNECSPFRTWIHCDLRPLNVVYLENTQVQLLDFECAGFGHALLDAVSVRMAFPPPPAPVVSSGQAVPPAVIRRFEQTYRAELIKGIPEAADDACFHEALVQACAHWALIKLLSMWQIHLKERLAQGASYDSRDDIAPHKAAYARFRQQGITYLQTFVDTAEEFEQLPTIRIAAQMVIAALLKIWPEIEPLPYFPAFRHNAD
ncbi:MAG: phosphotransferase [Anaerolineae bacterium]|jgi:hypothetical protein